MKHNEKRYFRVTEVLFPASGLFNIDPQVLKYAAERGSKVDEICKALIQGIGVCDIQERLMGYTQSFEEWVDGKKFLETPERFFCDVYDITGECDAILDDQGKHILVDFKTPAKVSKTWQLQLSAYAYLARQKGLKIDGIAILKIDRDGSPAKFIPYEEDFEGFLECLKYYRRFYKDSDALAEYLKSL